MSASYKNRLTFITRTTAVGAYKIRGFTKDILPNEVVVTCSKEGYKQDRVIRRPLLKSSKPLRTVETECRLRRL